MRTARRACADPEQPALDQTRQREQDTETGNRAPLAKTWHSQRITQSSRLHTGFRSVLTITLVFEQQVIMPAEVELPSLPKTPSAWVAALTESEHDPGR